MRGIAALFVLSVLFAAPSSARACGGFFCGNQPVDQQAERILFAVGESSTDMIVQISYAGASEDFAWVLPLADVPPVESLDTFPALALTALDANTAPMFFRPEDAECQIFKLDGGGGPESTPGVTVHIMETVGPYMVAVIEGDDGGPVVTWLRDNGYRVTDPMVPFIAEYAASGMKLLALKLAPGRDTSDIEPFRVTLPGTTPSIPIRITALAAEPEMGILVILLGDQRYGPANWAELEIADADIVWSPRGFPEETNWTALVARAADGAGGRGFVTELAGPTAPLAEAVRAAPPSSPEQEEAAAALLELLDAHPYLTRLYGRLSPEEMTVDPIFRRHDGGDVDARRQLERFVGGVDLCEGLHGGADPLDPCDFTSCGAGGRCRAVLMESGVTVAGCVCDGALTARTTFAPRGDPIVVCQEPALSFLNPGDRDLPGGLPLPDTCVGFDCGDGECIPVNLTPTCRCPEGRVAIGWLDAGERRTTCVDPDVPVPDPIPSMPGIEPPEGPPAPPPVRPAGGGCATAPGAPSLAWLAALLLLVIGRRQP